MNRRLLAYAGLALLFVGTQLGALTVTVGLYGVTPTPTPALEPAPSASPTDTPTTQPAPGGTQTAEPKTETQEQRERRNDPMRGLLFLVIIVTETAIILAFKRVQYLQDLLKAALKKLQRMPWWAPATAAIVYVAFRTPGDTPYPVAFLSLTLLVSYPIAVYLLIPVVKSDSWWALDTKALVGGAFFTPLFADSLGPTPVIVFLVLMMMYDFIAVYITGHMVELAESVPAWLPVYFAVPGSREKLHSSASIDMADNDFAILGLGDAVLPAVLVVVTVGYYGAAGSAAAVGALVGAQIGLGIVLLLLLRYDRAHAGLPPIISCSLLGWFLAAFAFGPNVFALF